MKNHRVVALAALVALSCLGSVGCQDKKATGSSSSATAVPDAGQAKQFVATLKAMPVDQRRDYAGKHQDLVNAVNTGGDPSLRSEFMQLMMAAPPAK